MVNKIVGVIVGLIAGLITITIVQTFSSLAYPMPADLDPTNHQALKEWFETLPIGAFAFVLLAHALGALVAALVCSAIVGHRWTIGSLIIGTLFLAAGILNLMMIPHPTWFAVVDLLLYLPAALLGGGFLAKPSPVALAQNEGVESKDGSI